MENYYTPNEEPQLTPRQAIALLLSIALLTLFMAAISESLDETIESPIQAKPYEVSDSLEGTDQLSR